MQIARKPMSGDGMVLTLAYDAQGRLLTATNPFGRSLTFDYADSEPRVQGVTDSCQQRTRFSYDAKRGVLVISFPGGAQRTYLYNEPAHTDGADLPDVLTGIIDELGFRYATHTYDATGRTATARWSGPRCQRGSESAGFWGHAEIGHGACLIADRAAFFLKTIFLRSGTYRSKARGTYATRLAVSRTILAASPPNSRGNAPPPTPGDLDGDA